MAKTEWQISKSLGDTGQGTRETIILLELVRIFLSFGKYQSGIIMSG
jgi:hypothetical protein